MTDKDARTASVLDYAIQRGDQWRDSAFAAEAERDEAKAELADLRATLDGVRGTLEAANDAVAEAAVERAETAEAKIARVEAALTAWEDSYGVDPLPEHWGITTRIAELRAALEEAAR